jgi:hypothetical protein
MRPYKLIAEIHKPNRSQKPVGTGFYRKPQKPEKPVGFQFKTQSKFYGSKPVNRSV